MKTVTIDIETSGLVPKGLTYEADYMKFPRILSMAWKINGDPVKEFIINQDDRKIPAEATKINGITQEMCDASPYKFIDVIKEFIIDADQNDYILGHNIYFDTSIIKANVLLAWGNMESFKIITEILHKDKRIDTMRAGTKLCGKWPKLTELYMKLFMEEYEAHSAGADCEACYRCYEEMVKLNLITYPVMKGGDI